MCVCVCVCVCVLGWDECTCLPHSVVLCTNTRVVLGNVDDDQRVQLDLSENKCSWTARAKCDRR